MKNYRGKSVCRGITVGELLCRFHSNRKIPTDQGHCPEIERERFLKAKNQAIEELRGYCEKNKETAGEEQAAIFSMHLIMLEDDELEELANQFIEKGYTAEYAADQAGRLLSERLAAMNDDYMRARAADALDISGRICAQLIGENNALPVFSEPVILVSDDLSPSEVVRLDRKKILALVLTEGSESAHMAILVRTMGIPTIIQTKIGAEDLKDGTIAVVDANEGIFTILPDEITLNNYRSQIEEERKAKNAQQTWIGKPNRSKDGKDIKLYCNIGNSSETELVLENDGGGIGLYRSEFLYLEASDYPSEETQFQEYKKLVQKMAGKPVIIRTMDVGADKQAAYFHLENENNPAMGYRSIRICRDRPEILSCQLRAIYRASVYGTLLIMVPMIISVEEIKWVKKLAAEVRNALQEEGIPFYEHVPIGIMVETPAAAILSDRLAEEVDFFSIGTNDLTQYALAVDRQNDLVADLYDPKHPALLRLIAWVVQSAHEKGKWVGICGELARDPKLIAFFLAIGVDELSVSPPYVLPIRQQIAEINASTVDVDVFLHKKNSEQD